MSAKLTTVATAAVKDANVLIVVVTTVLAALTELVQLPFIPASDSHWATAAIVFGGVFLKVLKDVVADVSAA